MKTFRQFMETARNKIVPLDPYMTVPSDKGRLKLIKKDIPPIWDDPLAKVNKNKVVA
tara:strand:+ start:1261 stop:1431 length:171 start_codon:yes stop_codon:yes gene_type:complete